MSLCGEYPLKPYRGPQRPIELPPSRIDPLEVGQRALVFPHQEPTLAPELERFEVERGVEQHIDSRGADIEGDAGVGRAHRIMVRHLPLPLDQINAAATGHLEGTEIAAHQQPGTD